MSNQQKLPKETGKGDPTVVRTKDNPFGTDDIGLPAETHSDEARKPEEVKPDPEKVRH